MNNAWARIYLVFLIVVLVLAGIFLGRFRLARSAKQKHYQQLDALAQQGSGFEAKADAVEQLGHYDEDYANRLLLKIAEDPDTNPGMRVIALSYLSKHHVLYNRQIAKLIIPQESLKVRLSAVEALLQLGCPPECMREVLHYEERLFYGENTAEHLVMQQPISDVVRKSLQADVDQLDREVRMVLQTNEGSTIEVLVQVYGLGGLEPAKFALQTAQKMRPASVCGLLQQSANDRLNILGKSADDFSLFLNSVINKHCTGERHG